MKRLVFLVVLLIVAVAGLKVGLYQGVSAQTAIRPADPAVPDAQRTDEQKAIAAEFAPNEMANAVGTLLMYPRSPAGSSRTTVTSPLNRR